MQRFLTLLFVVTLSVSFSASLATRALAQEVSEERRPVRLDRNHSTLGFRVPIVHGLGTVTGKFTDWSVDLFWDENDLDNSSVSVEIQTASVDTGIDGRDSDLRSDSFFNSQVYPAITFTSSSISGGPFEYKVDGTFTMLGVSKNITLSLDVRSWSDSDDDDGWTAFRVNYTLDRTDYGMMWRHSSVDFFVGDNIATDIVLITR